MAQQYDNNNTFVLFKNDQGDNPKRPNYTGSANLDGIEFRLSGWIRESAKGKFISGQVQLKEVQGETRSKPAVEGADEDVPF
jgi:hypothetical protein